MELIIDANILFSALIKDGHTRHFLLFSGYTFYTPEFIFNEIKKHISTISEKTLLSDIEIKSILEYVIILSNIKIIPLNEFREYLEKAKQICPDMNDIQYFALALKLNCSIWSNDKLLKGQNKVKIYSTQEIISLFKNA